PEVAVIQRYVAAINDADVATIRSLLADDFQMLRPWPKCKENLAPVDCHIKMLKDTALRDREQCTITAVTQQLETVRVNLTIASKALQRRGIERILITEEFVVLDDKIRSTLVTLRTEDEQTRRYRDGLKR